MFIAGEHCMYVSPCLLNNLYLLSELTSRNRKFKVTFMLMGCMGIYISVL